MGAAEPEEAAVISSNHLEVEVISNNHLEVEVISSSNRLEVEVIRSNNRLEAEVTSSKNQQQRARIGRSHQREGIRRSRRPKVGTNRKGRLVVKRNLKAVTTRNSAVKRRSTKCLNIYHPEFM